MPVASADHYISNTYYRYALISIFAMIRTELMTALPHYTPGDAVMALLKVSSKKPSSVEHEQIEICFIGIERVDTAWISPSYRKDVAPLNADRRRVQRPVIRAQMRAVMQGSLSNGEERSFLIRFVLPEWLPPTFKGTAVKYFYYLQASVTYTAEPELRVMETGQEIEAAPGGGIKRRGESEFRGGGQDLGEKRVAVCRSALHIWPSDVCPEISSNLSQRGFVVEDGVGAVKEEQASGSGTMSSKTILGGIVDDVAIKCWEVGPSTEVGDAVNHIKHVTETLERTTSGSSGLEGASPPSRKVEDNSHDTATPLQGYIVTDTNAQSYERRLDNTSSGSKASSVRIGSQDASQGTGLSPKAPGVVLEDNLSTAEQEHDKHKHLASIDDDHERRRNSGMPSGSEGPKTYGLRVGDEPLAKVSLHYAPVERILHPGSTFFITFEFPNEEISSVRVSNDDTSQVWPSSAIATTKKRWKCLKVTASLEIEEEIHRSWDPRASKKSLTSSKDARNSTNSLRHVVDEQVEWTLDAECTNFMFMIPQDATPNFRTALVSLKWLVRFEVQALLQNGLLKHDRRIETLLWSLPLNVLPP